jgi:hypothetical protein
MSSIVEVNLRMSASAIISVSDSAPAICASNGQVACFQRGRRGQATVLQNLVLVESLVRQQGFDQ